MRFTKLTPSLFYTDINIGLKSFVDCLEFTIGHDEIDSPNPFCVVQKDGLGILIFQNKELAEQFSPEIRLVTENIEEVYERVSSKFPELLHPNLSRVTLRPWGAKEFALVDGQIGIIIQQW
ncbi:MAG: hypothetical protein JST68_30865 [Bacteroidetes bacterium]|nr:hypothetical protein [Bacteroidota bacterium]